MTIGCNPSCVYVGGRQRGKVGSVRVASAADRLVVGAGVQGVLERGIRLIWVVGPVELGPRGRCIYLAGVHGASPYGGNAGGRCT